MYPHYRVSLNLTTGNDFVFDLAVFLIWKLVAAIISLVFCHLLHSSLVLLLVNVGVNRLSKYLIVDTV